MIIDLKYLKYVVHCKKSKYDVFIGRPSIWSNPYSHLDFSRAKFKVDSREEAIKKYEEMIMADPEMIAKIKKELKNKVLGCFCLPAQCHGFILAKIANEDNNDT